LDTRFKDGEGGRKQKLSPTVVTTTAWLPPEQGWGGRWVYTSGLDGFGWCCSLELVWVCPQQFMHWKSALIHVIRKVEGPLRGGPNPSRRSLGHGSVLRRK
jgi:hypothetical protein